MDEINNCTFKLDSGLKICAEIYRNDAGLYSFVCFHCGYSCCSFENINTHINDTHFTYELFHIEDEITYEVISDTKSEESCILIDTSDDEADNPVIEEDSIELLSKKQQEVPDNQEKEQNTDELLLVPIAEPRQTEQKSECAKNKKIKFECYICEKTLSSIGAIRSHMPTHNEQKTKFKCEICSKILGSKHALMYHIRIHTGERPYMCMFCEKSFTFRSSLENHKRFHTKKNQYKTQIVKCNFCSKKMCSKESLKQHIRIHTGEKPYKCELCRKCFTFRSSLTNHQHACIKLIKKKKNKKIKKKKRV